MQKEKNKEIEKYRNANIIVMGERSQGKKHLMEIKIKELQNQKAIEQLKKVKAELVKLGQDYSLNWCGIKIYNFIDNQINELKGKAK